MRPRINSPAISVPGVLDALQALSKSASDSAEKAGLSRATLELLSLRASQINAWNRLNITTGQIAGEWTAQWVA